MKEVKQEELHLPIAYINDKLVIVNINKYTVDVANRNERVGIPKRIKIEYRNGMKGFYYKIG